MTDEAPSIPPPLATHRIEARGVDRGWAYSGGGLTVIGEVGALRGLVTLLVHSGLTGDATVWGPRGDLWLVWRNIVRWTAMRGMPPGSDFHYINPNGQHAGLVVCRSGCREAMTAEHKRALEAARVSAMAGTLPNGFQGDAQQALEWLAACRCHCCSRRARWRVSSR